MTRLLALAAILALSGCAAHHATGPGIPTGVDVVCPDPPPVKPDVIVGNTPCVFANK